MHEAAVARQLQGAELWGLPADADATAAARSRAETPVLLAGWEDGDAFCAAVCSTDVGLLFCRRCPEEVVGRVAASGRPAKACCPAGVRLLAFPAPRGARRQIAVLRVAPPAPAEAATVGPRIRVAPAVLRKAARRAPAPDHGAVRSAARVLRDPAGLFAWQTAQRAGGADRRRTATAALAQMIATSEEMHDLYRSSERQRAELHRSRRQVDRLARETLRAADRERARIAHQIHDTAAQSMVSAFRFLEAARASARGRDAPADVHLAAASERLVAAIGEVRAVLASLLPPGLEEFGLHHAIERRLREFASDANIRGEVRGELPRLPEWVEQALYGMAAEAMSNAIRHGRAMSVHVELRVQRGRATVTVSDDGQGFDPSAQIRRTSTGGLGLLGLARQASWLGGRATVDSRPGAGTRVRISIPIARHLPSAAAEAADQAAVAGPSPAAGRPTAAEPTGEATAQPAAPRADRAPEGARR
jgi:signal transduction histidine kinase